MTKRAPRGTRGRSIKLKRPLELPPAPPPPPGTYRVDHYPENGGPRTTQYFMPGTAAADLFRGAGSPRCAEIVNGKACGAIADSPDGLCQACWIDRDVARDRAAELAAQGFVDASADELAGALETTPRPSCCVECGGPLVGYSTCGKAACVFNVILRQRRGRPG